MMYKILFALTFVACVSQNATEGKPLAKADDVALASILETGDDATLEFNLDHLDLTERQKRDLMGIFSDLMAGHGKSLLDSMLSMFRIAGPNFEKLGTEMINVAKSLLVGKMDLPGLFQLAMNFMPGY